MSLLAKIADPADDGRVPTRTQAFAIWALSGIAILLASIAVVAIATAVAVWTGVDPRVLADPKVSPVFTSALWVALGTMPAQLGLIASVGVALWLLKPNLRAVLPLKRPTPAAVIGGVLVVFGLSPLASLAAEAAHRFMRGELTVSHIIMLAARDASAGELTLMYVALAVLPAIGEESMFRGLITASFLRSSRIAGILIPSILFGLFHLEPVQAAGTIVLGVGFGLARVYTGSLIPGAVAHCLYNAAVISLARFGVDTDSRRMPWWGLAGGAFILALGLALLESARRSERTAA